MLFESFWHRTLQMRCSTEDHAGSSVQSSLGAGQDLGAFRFDHAQKPCPALGRPYRSSVLSSRQARAKLRCPYTRQRCCCCFFTMVTIYIVFLCSLRPVLNHTFAGVFFDTLVFAGRHCGRGSTARGGGASRRLDNLLWVHGRRLGRHQCWGLGLHDGGLVRGRRRALALAGISRQLDLS